MTKLSLSNRPLVTVIIPFFNSAKFLSEAIESVLTQTIENWELILVDDKSTDSSPNIARKYVEKYPGKVFLHSHQGQQNLGASHARNIGLEKSTGQFISFLDSDDVFFPNTLEQELFAFEKCPEADVVCGKLEFWHTWENRRTGNEIDFTLNLGLELERLYQPPALLIHNLRASGRKPGINSLMIKRDFIDSIGAFEGNFRHVSEDQVFWAKVSLNGNIYVMDAILAKYRQHPESSCARLFQNHKEVQNWEVYVDWLENHLKEKQIENTEIRDALRSVRKEIYWQKRLKFLKNLYQRNFPLHTRYWVRDKFIEWRLRKK